MTRYEAAQMMIAEDLTGMVDLINVCPDSVIPYFMLGGLLYIATVVNGAVEWCEKANIHAQCFIDRKLLAELRAKVKLYSSDKCISLEKQKELMSSIVKIEKQYWIDRQVEKRLPCPMFLISDVGSYLVNGHFIGNTLEYAYEFSPLNPDQLPIIKAIGGDRTEESRVYRIAAQIRQTIRSLYTAMGIKEENRRDEITIIVKDYDFRMSNKTFFGKENAVFAFNLLCRVNFLLEFLLPMTKNSLLFFRMMYITFYHLQFELENLGLTSIHYDMPYRDERFRNAMAHYSLYGKLADGEIVDNVIGYGLFEKSFKESFEVVNQAMIGELIRTRDSLEQYVTIK